MSRDTRVFCVLFFVSFLMYYGRLFPASLKTTRTQDQVEIQIPKEPPRSENGLASAALILDLVIGNEPANESSLFYSLNGIQVGNVYVLDFNKQVIVQFNEAGRFVKTIGHRGTGPGNLSMADYLTIPPQISGHKSGVFNFVGILFTFLDSDSRRGISYFRERMYTLRCRGKGRARV